MIYMGTWSVRLVLELVGVGHGGCTAGLRPAARQISFYLSHLSSFMLTFSRYLCSTFFPFCSVLTLLHICYLDLQRSKISPPRASLLRPSRI